MTTHDLERYVMTLTDWCLMLINWNCMRTKQ